MIVPMKTITLVCLESEREPSLASLRDLGLLHLRHVRPPAGTELDEARRALERAENALAILDAHAPEKKAPEANLDGAAAPADGDLVAAVRDRAAARRAAEDRLQALRAEEKAAAPLGDFDPALLASLAGHGVTIRIYPVIGGRHPSLPEGVLALPLRGTGSETYLVAVGLQPFEAGDPPAALPSRRLSAIRAEIRRTETELASVEGSLRTLAARRPGLAVIARELRERVQFEEARAGMGLPAGSIAYLQGYCPAPRLEELRQAAATHGWGLLISDPDPAEAVPTLIRMPRWVRPIRSLFDMIKIVPGYREVDVSASFLLFLSVFYAMIIGDAGYGIVFLLLTIWARSRFRRAPPEPFALMLVFNLCTIAWGVLTGTYFGMVNKPIPLPGLPEAAAWLGESRNMMFLCLLIGAVHLTVAHTWSAIRQLRALQCLAQVGWIGLTWSLFFLAKGMLLGAPFPRAAGLVAVAGVVLILLFMTPPRRMKSEWINHAMLPLTFMSSFGDVLSYLRLFALGIAGVQLAMAFNTIALTMGFDSPLRILGSVLVLFLGHALNIVLGLMSVLVHGIRLNALEFSGHMGLEWSGTQFAPFSRRASSR